MFEAGRQADAIITARKGTGKILATAQGRAAHAGNHHAEGVNAIVAMARLIEATQALTDYERGVTINAGTIHGGQGRNVVPDHCEALFDMRFVSMADGKWLEERFTQAALEAAASVPGSSIELQGGVARPPLERCEANVALFEEYASCAKAAGLGHGEAALIGGGSDASTIAAIGVPAIDGLGPRGSGFHTKDELIEVPTLLQRLEALARFLVRRGAMLIITTLLLGAGVVACAGDHSGLAKGDTTASGGATGSGGAATTSSKTTSSSSIVEPSGPTKLTIVNGAVDYEAVRLCFVPYPAGATGSELPWPGSVEGLPFARASVVDNIEQIVPASTDVQVVVVAGNLSQTGGKSCSSLIATPPSGVEQRSVGVLPESVFSEDKSLLLVTYGCIGGADHSHEAQASVCGASYASDAPTVGLAAGFMSRLVQEGKASIQLVHAVVAMEQVAIRFVPGVDDATHYLIENEWSLGAISPFPPYSKLPAADWGKVAEAQLEIYLPNQGSPQVVTALSEVLANSTLNADAVVDGKGLVFVAVGAGPGVEEGPWWKPLTYTMVQADP